jgi:hypothetical protein
LLIHLVDVRAASTLATNSIFLSFFSVYFSSVVIPGGLSCLMAQGFLAAFFFSFLEYMFKDRTKVPFRHCLMNLPVVVSMEPGHRYQYQAFFVLR